MLGLNPSAEPRYSIMIFQEGRRIALHGEDDSLRARLLFDYAVKRYEQAGADRRIELYDGSDLVELWSRGEAG